MNIREADNPEDEKDKIIQQSLNGAPNTNQSVPMSNEEFEPISDGEIPQNSEGIVSGQFDNLNGVGNAQIAFKQGNYNQILGYPQQMSDKLVLFTQTFIPLIEVALIELLGTNQLYQREMAQCMPAFQNNQMLLSGTLVYSVNNWIGTDIDQNAIMHDSQYVFNRIKPSGVNITKCEISTESGTLTIMFTL